MSPQNDDNFKLGRGLESLIPKQAKPNQGATPGQVRPYQTPQQPIQKPQQPQQVPQAQPQPQPQSQAQPQMQMPSIVHHYSVPQESGEPKEPMRIGPTSEVAPQDDKKPQSQPQSQPSQTPKPAEPQPVQKKLDVFEQIKKDAGSPPKIDAIFHIEVEKIRPNPDQPRKNFDEESIRDLAASIREFGLLQPIVVTKLVKEVPGGTDVEYVLISGERRLKAAKLLGLERIPAIVRNVDLERERLELAIIENIQRENLNPVEAARAMARLQDEFRLTQREIAVRLSKSRESVANTLRLLDLPQVIQDALEKGKISESHGRLLLAVDDPGLQEKLYRDLADNKLTTRELRIKVEAAKPKQRSLYEKKELPPEIKMAEERLRSQLGAPVQIDQKGAAGKITISFYSEEELRAILERLAKEEEL